MRASGARDDDLVLDLGAGRGAITRALAGAGAQVIAVERDARLAARLRQRFDGDQRVRVVEADLLALPLPRREFLVVANPPFSVTTALCRRLLGNPAVRLAGAQMIVQWGAARWLANPRPRDAETAWWACRYELRLAQPVSCRSFVPPPRVDAAWLSVRPRPITGSARGQRQLRMMLRHAYRTPRSRADVVLPGRRKLLMRAAVDPRTPVALVTAEQWHRLAMLLASGDP